MSGVFMNTYRSSNFTLMRHRYFVKTRDITITRVNHYIFKHFHLINNSCIVKKIVSLIYLLQILLRRMPIGQHITNSQNHYACSITSLYLFLEHSIIELQACRVVSTHFASSINSTTHNAPSDVISHNKQRTSHTISHKKQMASHSRSHSKHEASYSRSHNMDRHSILNHTAGIKHLISDHTTRIMHPTLEPTANVRHYIAHGTKIILFNHY